MPIHLFEFKTREGIAHCYVYDLYNWIPIAIHNPGRVVTDSEVLLSLLVYSIPSFLHIGLCRLAARIATYLIFRFWPRSAHDREESDCVA